jgi:hypothetical protein
MKAFVVLGSIVGFLTGATFGMAGNSPLSTALWRACAGALAAAILTRWWSRVWVDSLRDSLERRENPSPTNNKPAAKS